MYKKIRDFFFILFSTLFSLYERHNFFPVVPQFEAGRRINVTVTLKIINLPMFPEGGGFRPLAFWRVGPMLPLKVLRTKGFRPFPRQEN